MQAKVEKTKHTGEDMAKKSGKRSNPRKIPISKSEINRDELVTEAVKGNYFRAWLIVLPSLMELEGITPERVIEIWQIVTAYATGPAFTKVQVSGETRRAAELMGFSMPYKVWLDDIRTQGELDAAKRKLRDNAVYSAMSIICLGLDSENVFDEDTIRKIFLNASITRGELQAGLTTYENLAEEVKAKGILVQSKGTESVHMELYGTAVAEE